MTLKNKIFLEALKRNNNEANIPVWLLRQAGRYLPEYMKIRSEYSDFFQMIKKPDVCKELTLQPFRRSPLDPAITFTHILTIPDAMGVPVEFIAGKGPVFADSIEKNHLLKLNPDGAVTIGEDKVQSTMLSDSLTARNVKLADFDDRTKTMNFALSSTQGSNTNVVLTAPAIFDVRRDSKAALLEAATVTLASLLVSKSLICV